MKLKIFIKIFQRKASKIAIAHMAFNPRQKHAKKVEDVNKTGRARVNKPNIAKKAANTKVTKNVNKKKQFGKDRIVFTRENINSHLVNSVEHPENYKLLGMLTYLFKDFKTEPQNLLAKLKILTMKKKNKNENHSDDDTTARMIMKQLFMIFEMNGEFYKNIFDLLKTKSYLTEIATDFYFQTPMSNEDFREHFDILCDELIKVWKPKAYASFEDFQKAFEALDAIEVLENIKLQEEEAVSEESLGVEKVGKNEYIAKIRDSTGIDVSIKQQVVDQDDSSFSLISLDDEDQIQKLDIELGKIFQKDSVSEENKAYSMLLIRSLESLIRQNSIFDINMLLRLLYIDQHDEIYVSFKHVIKSFISKFSDKKRIFRIYQNAAIEIPQLYKLFGIFSTHCGSDFDTSSFIKVAINHHHGDMILNRIDPGQFYVIYNPTLGVFYDAFYTTLIRLEKNSDTLKSLLDHENTVGVVEVINEMLVKLEKRAAKASKESISGKDLVGEELSDVEVVSDEVVEVSENKLNRDEDVISKQYDKEPKPKLTFADKIGRKIFDDKKAKTKQFRMQNLKLKTKAKKLEKSAAAEKESKNAEKIKFTKASLREKQAMPKNKKVKKNNQ